jgi:predicted metal-dependent hydrolase
MNAIHVRRQRFDPELGAGGLWNPRLPELSHTLNAFQLALPYLEPYFIKCGQGGPCAGGLPRWRVV